MPKSATVSALPKFRDFQLATLSDEVPKGDGWLFEMKYDGYRCQAAISGTDVKLYSRGGHDWTDKFGFVAPALSKLTKGTLLIDGEICAVDAKGRSDFSLLKTSLDGKQPIIFFAFDLLEQDGEAVWRMAQSERKDRLRAVIGEQADGVPLIFSDHVEGHGEAAFRAMCEGGYEGMVAKRASAIYSFGDRSANWLKVKCVKRQEFVVIGWRKSEEHVGVRALFLATYGNGELVYRGGVGTGFTDKVRKDLMATLKPLQSAPLKVEGMPRPDARDCQWVAPKLLAEVAYTEITPDGLIRHPSFKGLREDKGATDAHLEKPGSLP